MVQEHTKEYWELQMYRRGWKSGANGAAPNTHGHPQYDRGYADGQKARAVAFDSEAKRLGVTEEELIRSVLR